MNVTTTTSRRRRSATCARTATPTETAILMLLIVTLFALAWLSGRASSDGLATLDLRVRPGQTLWSIAREHPTPGRSTAETVELLSELNGLEGGTLVAGDVLRVPAAEGGSFLKVASR